MSSYVKQCFDQLVSVLTTAYTYVELYTLYLLYDPCVDTLNTWNGIPYVAYTYKNKPYRVFVDDRKGPSNILKITDQGDFDCTEDVRPFLGPSGLPRYARLTPHMLGFDKLTFYTLRDGVITCSAHDDIYTTFKKNN